MQDIDRIENLQDQRPGFLVRVLASWIDILFVYAVVKLFFYIQLAFHTNLYIPFEFTVFILFILYSMSAVAITGSTIGKRLLQLKVRDKNNSDLSVFKSLLRESIAKLFSFCVLGLGFLWIGFSKRKKGWHDLIVGSEVKKTQHPLLKNVPIKLISALSLLLVLGKPIIQDVILVYHANRMELSRKLSALAFMNRGLSEVKNISQIRSDTAFVNWLNSNAKTPEDYAIEIASNHQLTLFGEMHGIRENLELLNRIIPDLYYKAGIRCIAMECIPATMNNKLRHLINARAFDRGLQMQVARSQPWTSWGGKEYWDVLETVWRLNNNLSDGQPKMSIVGIDSDWNGPDFALSFPGSYDALGNVPFCERFRLFSSLTSLPKLIYRDGIMAYNVKKEILDKGIKGIVWIGANHTDLKFAQCTIRNDKLVSINARFGLMLYQRYKEKIAQIVMWNTTRNYLVSDNPPSSMFDSLFEATMSKRNNQPAGFSISDSPFANLHDTTAMFFSKYPTLCVSDMMENVIFFKPFREMKETTWMPGYLSEKTFLENKPFYKLKLNKDFRFNSAKELNDYMNTVKN